ncbi:TPM domain-containing protein [Treponema pectinovorum]|uniref:TPM domain-containing protein n=1 Tax=Treponema pectinovorum TaxID=164 RepID=UPI0011C94149|nr:TPM domain-containing protein [Treponema pectinovorum]
MKFYHSHSFKSFVLFFLFIFLGTTFLSAKEISIPVQKAWITDNAGLINPQTLAKTESFLEEIDKQTGVQIAVLTVQSLGEDEDSVSIEEYASLVFEKWRLGQANKDNGILLVVSLQDRAVRIEVGYGLEGVLTDTKCGLIIRNFIIPHFKEGDYSGGILEGIKILAGYATDDQKIKDKVESSEDEGLTKFIPLFMWLVFVAIIIISNIFGPRGGNRRPPRSGGFFFGGGFGGGSSFGGGSFGGGFSGGGGGRSGGGGASGRW